MKPTEELMTEHEAILKMLEILEKLLSERKRENSVLISHLNQILIFFKVFVDKCHHGKEEKFLFPAFEEAGIPNEGGPIGVMLEEHRLGRKYVSQMTDALKSLEGGPKPDLSEFEKASGKYIDLLRNHIEKENRVLFPMGDAKMTAKDRKQISDEFFRWEKEEIGEEQHEKFHKQMENLKSIYIP